MTHSQEERGALALIILALIWDPIITLCTWCRSQTVLLSIPMDARCYLILGGGGERLTTGIMPQSQVAPNPKVQIPLKQKGRQNHPDNAASWLIRLWDDTAQSSLMVCLMKMLSDDHSNRSIIIWVDFHEHTFLCVILTLIHRFYCAEKMWT